MTFTKKKLGWIGVAVLAFCALCFVLCGAKTYNPTENPYEIVETSKCQSLVNGLEFFLKTRAQVLIAESKGKNTEFLEITPKVKLLKCINNTRAKVNVKTDLKIKVKLVDPDTKKEITEIGCGTTDETMFLQQKGAFVHPEPSDEKPKPVNITPCE